MAGDFRVVLELNVIKHKPQTAVNNSGCDKNGFAFL
jgi:hypothetical protein